MRTRNGATSAVATGAALRRWVAGGFLLLALVACETLFPPPDDEPPPGQRWHEQAVLASPAVSGFSLEVAFDPAVATFRGISGGPQGAIAASAKVDAGAVTVTYLSTGPQSGRLLTLHWSAVEGSTSPSIAAAAAYRADGEAANGALSLGSLVRSGAGKPEEGLDALGAASAGQEATAACRAADYGAELADRPLGDLDRSGDVEVLDAVLLAHAITGGLLATAEAYELLHADLTGDCSYDDRDLRQLFAKVASSDASAVPVIKPQALTYADLRAGRPVLVMNGGNESLAGATFEGVNLNGTQFSGDLDWAVAGQSALWTLASDPNDALGVLRVSAGDRQAEVRVGNIAILIAGQSNAVGWDPYVPPHLADPSDYPDVRMLGNDYRWQPATEPLDDATDQLDNVSKDSTPGTSPGTQLGRLLNAGDESAGIVGTGRPAYLIPAALGASRMTPRGDGVGWYLGSSDLSQTNRATLFGSAAYRALTSSGERSNPRGSDPEGGPVSAVLWYQGESDSSGETFRLDYSSYTEQVFQAFQAHLAGASNAVDPVVIYAQLAPYGCCEGDETEAQARARDLRTHDVAERQRRLEAGTYKGTPHLIPGQGFSNGIADVHMIVTHDLPRSDRIHLSAEAQRVLAERAALAYQEHVLGWDVDGTGPRITGVSRSERVITLTLDRDVAQTASPGPNGYSDYFTVYWGAPDGNSSYGGYGGNEIEIADVRRDPNDPRKVLITMAADYTNVYLRYKRPFAATGTSAYVDDVIRGSDSGLPLPSFGPLRVN